MGLITFWKNRTLKKTLNNNDEKFYAAIYNEILENGSIKIFKTSLTNNDKSLLNYLKDSDSKVYALCPDAKNLNKLSNDNNSYIKSGKLILKTGDLDKSPFDIKFDFILDLNTFYKWKKPIQKITQIYRTLEESGIFLLAFNTRSFLDKSPSTKAINPYSERQVLDAISQIGFITESYYVNNTTGYIIRAIKPLSID